MKKTPTTPKTEVKKEAPVVDTAHLEPYAADMRDVLPEDVNQGHLDGLVADMAKESKKIDNLFCTDEQGRAIKDKKLKLPEGVVLNIGR